MFNFLNPGDGLLLALDADVLVAKIYDAAKEKPDTVVIGDQNLVPSDALWKHFSAQQPREVYAADTRKAITAMGLSEEDCPACGIAYYRDGLVQVMLGRGLRSKDVKWAGNPDEPKLRIGGILCPRNSFEMFMEKARKESRSWSTSDIHVFIAFMVRVCEHSHNRMMATLKSGIEDANMKYFNAISRAKENCEFFVSVTLVFGVALRQWDILIVILQFYRRR
jgi:Phytochrome region